jgi:monofunctional glycosyltransferase
MTPLMVFRFVDQVVDGRKIVVKHFRVPIEQISNNMIYGVMAGEDQRFLQHRGVDFQALRNALEQNVRHKSLSIGGSTITQQTAKNVFLRPDRSLFRKAMEFYFAILMEL